jgi:hypothetical protein
MMHFKCWLILTCLLVAAMGATHVSDRPSHPLRIHRSTSRSRRLDLDGGHEIVHKTVVHQESGRWWRPEPIMPDRSDSVHHTFVKTALYPHLCFWEVAAGLRVKMYDGF